jgi:hypothetical protein
MGFMAVTVFGAERVAIWARIIHPEPGAPVLCVVTFIVKVPGDWASVFAPSSNAGIIRLIIFKDGWWK